MTGGTRARRPAPTAGLAALMLLLAGTTAPAQETPAAELFAADVEQQWIRECDTERLAQNVRTCTEEMLALGRGEAVPFDEASIPLAFAIPSCEGCRTDWRFYCAATGITEVSDLVGLTVVPLMGSAAAYETLHAAGIGVAVPQRGQFRSFLELGLADCAALPVMILDRGGVGAP